jgi:hypothetical protein
VSVVAGVLPWVWRRVSSCRREAACEPPNKLRVSPHHAPLPIDYTHELSLAPGSAAGLQGAHRWGI